LKISSAYHSENDGASKQTNKTINQAICYHVQQNQKGWVQALPRIRFDIMNSVNASMDFSPFQLRLGCSPQQIPPLIPLEHATLGAERTPADIISQIKLDVTEAKGNLLQVKVQQAHYANRQCRSGKIFFIGDKVMFSMLHRRNEYKKKREKRTAKFFPHFNGLYEIIRAHPETHSYTINMPNSPNVFPTFYIGKLKQFLLNNAALFPSWELLQLGPILTSEGLEEYMINKIINTQRCRWSWKFLV
jgi:hypothetical protein